MSLVAHEPTLKDAAAALGRLGGMARTPAQRAWRARMNQENAAARTRTPAPELSILEHNPTEPIDTSTWPPRLTMWYYDPEGVQRRATGSKAIVAYRLRAAGYTTTR